MKFYISKYRRKQRNKRRKRVRFHVKVLRRRKLLFLRSSFIYIFRNYFFFNLRNRIARKQSLNFNVLRFSVFYTFLFNRRGRFVKKLIRKKLIKIIKARLKQARTKKRFIRGCKSYLKLFLTSKRRKIKYGPFKLSFLFWLFKRFKYQRRLLVYRRFIKLLFNRSSFKFVRKYVRNERYFFERLDLEKKRFESSHFFKKMRRILKRKRKKRKRLLAKLQIRVLKRTRIAFNNFVLKRSKTLSRVVSHCLSSRNYSLRKLLVLSMFSLFNLMKTKRNLVFVYNNFNNINKVKITNTFFYNSNFYFIYKFYNIFSNVLNLSRFCTNLMFNRFAVYITQISSFLNKFLFFNNFLKTVLVNKLTNNDSRIFSSYNYFFFPNFIRNSRVISAFFLLRRFLRSLKKYRQNLFFTVRPLLRIFKQLIRMRILNGYRLICNGRFSRKQRASKYVFSFGRISLSTVSRRIDYSFQTSVLKNSVCGFKLYLSFIGYRLEHLHKTNLKLLRVAFDSKNFDFKRYIDVDKKLKRKKWNDIYKYNNKVGRQYRNKGRLLRENLQEKQGQVKRYNLGFRKKNKTKFEATKAKEAVSDRSNLARVGFKKSSKYN